MPKPSWASEEQQTWLLSKLADFRQAQEAKTTPTFFIELYQKFHESWPVALPDDEEISQADGNEEKAKTDKQKASEQVSGSYSDIFCCMMYTY
jgi:predicted metal-dependent hydrolase